ncbi:MAG: glycosyltransferase family 2 protein [Phycisphaerae bacterium]
MVDEQSQTVADLPADVARNAYVVIAAYNEQDCLAQVVERVRRVYPNVVVVDDGSTDETFTEARRCATFALRHAVNRGQGAALQTGIDFALQRGAQFVVTFDGDGQHRVEDIAALLSPICAGQCEICLGSRFLGQTVGMPASRLLTLKLAVAFTRLVNGVKLTDAHNGLRAFSRKAATRIQITLDRMAHASELIDLIRETQLPFKEVPVQIQYTERSLHKGQSFRGAFRIVVHYLLGRVLR